VVRIIVTNHLRILACVMILSLMGPLGGIVKVEAAFPQVFVYPPSQTVDAIGNALTANVCVSDVFNLYAYQLKLYYNSTVLNGTSVADGPFLEGSGQTPFFYIEAFTDHYNSTYGIVWIDSTLVGNVLGVDGNGTLATIKFNATAPTSATPLSLRDMNLSDPNENPIPYISSDGTATILPEFTTTIAILTLFLILIPITLIIRKTHKRQDSKSSSR